MRKRVKRQKRRPNFWFWGGLVIFLGLLGWWGWWGVRNSVWDGKGRLNLVIESNPVVVVSLDPQENTLTLISIPDETYIEVPRGFGLYRMGAVYDLGNLDKNGGQLLSEAVQEFLGVAVDGYIKTQNSKLKTQNLTDEEMRRIVREVSSVGGAISFLRNDPLLKSLETNLTIYDLAGAWWLARQLHFDKIKFLDLGETTALEELILPDGTKGKTPDLARVDEQLRGLLTESEIQKEGLTIEVFNSTSKTGLGQKAARIINKLGVKVVGVRNREDEVGQCEIWGPKSYTVAKIAKVFACQEVKALAEGRAAVGIILGRHYLEHLTGKD